MWWLSIALAGPLVDLGAGIPNADAERGQPVIGGVPSEPGSWPEAAALFSNSSYACSGVLVAPDLVLTAGHCNFNLTEVQLDTVDHEREPGEVHTVTETWVHEDFFQTFDIALLRIAEPATVHPPDLALSCAADALLQDDALVTVVGFGATDPDGLALTTALNEAVLRVVDADCDDPSRGCNEAVMPAGELIAGGDGVDSCSGDSGGPLFALDSDGVPWLVGITSRSAVPSDTTCGDGGIYVRLDAIQDWIESVSGEALPAPDCDGVNQAPAPEPVTATVIRGEQVTIRIEPQDPDPDDSHSFMLEDPPEHGTATVGPEGLLVYTAPADAIGSDRLTVSVTDDGDPPIEATAIVDIEILDLDAPAGCACESGAPGPWWLMLLPIVWRRRC